MYELPGVGLTDDNQVKFEYIGIPLYRYVLRYDV